MAPHPGIVYLTISVGCSVGVSVLLKMARSRGLDMRQAILANYAVAALLSWLLLRPSFAPVATQAISWGVLIALGILLPAGFLAMANAVRDAGIVRADAAQRLSLVLTLIAAFVFFGDSLNSHKAVAIGLGLVALLCLLKRATANERESPRTSGAMWLLAVWLSYAAADTLIKQLSRAGVALPLTLFCAFLLAGILMLAYLAAKRVRWRRAPLLAGVLLGILNFSNILAYIRAHQSFPHDPSLVFSAMNIGVIALGTIVGAGIFKERVLPVNAVGLALSVAAIAVMATA